MVTRGDDEVAQVVALRRQGHSLGQILEATGLPGTTVKRWLKRWSDSASEDDSPDPLANQDTRIATLAGEIIQDTLEDIAQADPKTRMRMLVPVATTRGISLTKQSERRNGPGGGNAPNVTIVINTTQDQPPVTIEANVTEVEPQS